MSGCLLMLGMLVGCPPVASPPPVPASPAPPPADRWVAEDKLQHFAMSFAATGMAYGGARLALEPGRARAAAAGVAALLGIGKELADRRAGGPFSLKDLTWDAAGVALGYLFVQRIR